MRLCSSKVLTYECTPNAHLFTLKDGSKMLIEVLLKMDEEECLQKKVEFYHERLKSMASTIPRKYRQKISDDLLQQLANCLSNEINFEIVKGLMDIQHVTEKYLYHLRLKIMYNQDTEVAKALEQLPSEEHSSTRVIMAAKHKAQLREVDKKLVQQLDHKVSEQQETLEKAGFPGFYVTTNTTEIKVQMFLLDFILRLSKVEVPSESQ